jgi:hypothetical protein
MRQQIGLVVGAIAGVGFVAWLVGGQGPWGLAIGLLVSALLVMWFGYMIPRARMVLVNAGFFILLSGVFSSYANWIPQVEGPVPQPPGPSIGPTPESMPVDELAAWGEELIFGAAGGVGGKGQCPLCHGFVAGSLNDRAPNLVGIATRAAQRVTEARYLHPDSVQTESFPGSGRATTAVEYIAESHVCPSCYVAEGYGVRGTNDRVSPMTVIHKPPIGLTVDEQIAVDTFLFYREGGDVPPVSEIRAAYERFILPVERERPERVERGPDSGILATDTPRDLIAKLACAGCHKIPTTIATVGVIGPLLIEKTNAPKRLASREYQALVKAGIAHASTPKEYVMESIVSPNAFIVPGYGLPTTPPTSPMPHGFGQKLSYDALDRLAEFLLSLDEAAAVTAGMLDRPGARSGGRDSAG